MNRPFINGINFEERLRTKLEALGCRIYYDQTYDHLYKLDFIVNGFRDVARLPQHIGIQVTAKKDDVTKQREFLQVQKRSFVVPKAVYLEADPEADMEQVVLRGRRLLSCHWCLTEPTGIGGSSVYVLPEAFLSSFLILKKTYVAFKITNVKSLSPPKLVKKFSSETLLTSTKKKGTASLPARAAPTMSFSIFAMV